MTTSVSFIVEPFSISQFHAVCDLLRAAGWQENAIPSRGLFKSAESWRLSYVARAVDGSVIGFLRLVTDDETAVYITEVVVDSDWRRQGVGRALIDMVAAEFPTARIDLLSTSAAQPFYEALGFTQKPGYRRWPK